jgi:hypothetical protein
VKSTPDMRTFSTVAVVSEMWVQRGREGGFVFSIRRRGKDPVTHWISDAEAAMLGIDLQFPDRFGPGPVIEDQAEGA